MFSGPFGELLNVLQENDMNNADRMVGGRGGQGDGGG